MCLASLGRRARGVVGSLVLGSLAACSGSAPESASAPGARSPASEPAPPECAAIAAAEETVHVKNEWGTLEGTLLVPEGCGPRPVALIIAGSGPTDRDGNPTKMYRLLAEGLAERGVASLRYDKAGIAASGAAAPAEKDMRFEMGAHDAALFAKALRSDARFGQVTVVGHSEGSLVAMLAARETPIDRFVSLAGAGRPIGVVLREQLARNIDDPALVAKADDIIAALERGEYVDDVPASLEMLFRASVQGYLVSWMKYDPADVIRAAPFARVLVAQGTTDIQVSLTDANLLAAARPDARLLVIEQMNHVLKHADGMSNSAQNEAYSDPSLPVVSQLMDEIAAFAADDPGQR